MSSAHCATLLLCLMTISFIHAKEDVLCPGKYSVWDKWYDGCNWCVCSENGALCTDKSCHRIPVDQCDPVGEKWRDGCYKCQCKDSGIVCIADNKCVHAMRYRPFTCEPRHGCVCGLDGLLSCTADTRQLDVTSLGYPKRRHDNKYVSNMPHWSKDRYNALTKKMSCDDAKRWYAGTKRCFCEDDEAREATCGNPRHIAHRVDGFRFRISQCYSNQEWEYNCRKCKCHMYGFGFCVRIPNCKRNSASHTDRHVSMSKECEQGSSWRDGCKYCKCTSGNKIRCDSTGCNMSGHMGATEVKVNVPTIVLSEADIRLTGEGNSDQEKKEAPLPGAVDETKISEPSAQFQIPPPHDFDMARSFRPSVEDAALIVQVLCEGKYKPGEKFYDKCNFCECTQSGDSKCTAILCV